ncbi:MAG: IS66 family transposase [Silvibacterium sp.]
MITQDVFEAFLHCPTKSYLSSRPETPDATADQAQRQWEKSFQQIGSSRLRASQPAHEVGTLDAAAIERKQYLVLLECTVQTADLRADLHGLQLVQSARTKNRNARQYLPIRFLSAKRISGIDEVLLAFDAYVFSQAVGATLPSVGKLIHGPTYSTTTVSLTPLYQKVRSIIATIQTQQSSAAPPPVVLNEHCSQCQYAARCRKIATDADDLSLLAKMNERARKKWHQRGVFTVTQLSYTFRPRRRTSTHRSHDYALQALAIRENRVHVIGTSAFPVEGTQVYFDVEGDPDRDFYYCIGLRFQVGDVTIQRSYWADSPSDERTMWTACLQALGGIDAPRLVHYGAYETAFLRQMKKRYPDLESIAFVDELLNSAVNLLSTIYGRVYFPTYSNGLKDVARYLGFRWTEATASGLAALAWRRDWEYSRNPELKRQLITYNAEDCAAAQAVAGALAALSRSLLASDGAVVDVATLKREYPQRFGEIDFGLPEFQRINAAARWDHQRETVRARSTKRLQRERSEKFKAKDKVGVNKVVLCEEHRPKCCLECGATTIYRFGRLSRVVYDLKFFRTGIKRWVVRYSFSRYICWNCRTTFRQFASQPKYGSTICAYIAYQIIDLYRPQNAVARSMWQLFRIPASRGMIHRIKASVAERHEKTYCAIIERIVSGHLVHADETRATVSGKDAYVWCFTSLEDVAFVYSVGRNASTPQNVLRGFNGVLVSDFYAAYDAIACAQQKCLIHLMRDINDDLFKQPFNEEMKDIARRFAELLHPIVESVDRFGLKSRYLRKHRSAVERFYEAILGKNYQNELAAGYVRRFERNRDRLFTFLDRDGIPWNNNNAEHAIKAFVRLRNVVGGTSTPKGLRDYLVLLSISETCKYKGVSFLDFLRSGETDVDAFVGKR